MYNGAQVIKLDTCPSAPILTCCNVFELLSVFAVPLSEELKREFTLIFFQFVCMIEHNLHLHTSFLGTFSWKFWCPSNLTFCSCRCERNLTKGKQTEPGGPADTDGSKAAPPLAYLHCICRWLGAGGSDRVRLFSHNCSADWHSSSSEIRDRSDLQPEYD